MDYNSNSDDSPKSQSPHDLVPRCPGGASGRQTKTWRDDVEITRLEDSLSHSFDDGKMIVYDDNGSDDNDTNVRFVIMIVYLTLSNMIM